MNPNDNLSINKIGMPKAAVNEPIASYSAAAAEQGARIADPATNPITPGRVTQSQESKKEQGINSGYSSADQMAVIAKAFGMNIKATLSFGEGIDPLFGNHRIGKVTKDITQEDGSVKTVYISEGQKLNFAC